MGEFRWRTGARIVAVLDLIFSTIGLAIIVLVAVSLVVLFSTKPENFMDEPVNTVNGSNVSIQTVDVELVQRGKFKGLLALYAVLGVLLGFQVRFTLRLEKATQIEAESSRALNWSRSWRNFNIVFLLLIVLQIPLGVLWLIPSPVEDIAATIYAILMRIAFLIVVQLFVKELEHNMQPTEDDPEAATDYNRLV